MIRILDGSGGEGKPLSEQDLNDFLTTNILNYYLGAIDEKGHANIRDMNSLCYRR